LDAIGGISSKVLTQTLRRLERHGIVAHERGPGVAVRYAATALGHSLLGPVAVLADWAHTHAETVAAAQDATDDGGYPGVPEPRVPSWG
jgi:DNA-binding HxlR family transcriptional regulator